MHPSQNAMGSLKKPLKRIFSLILMSSPQSKLQSHQPRVRLTTPKVLIHFVASKTLCHFLPIIPSAISLTTASSNMPKNKH
jgi:hypothetical protein